MGGVCTKSWMDDNETQFCVGKPKEEGDQNYRSGNYNTHLLKPIVVW